MEWVLRSPQIHSTFSNLGWIHADGYHINENCNAALETILHNILIEDKHLRAYRRNISFGQNVKKDLIPLLINTKEDKTVELLIEILGNLTTPIECLFNVENISKSDFGRHTVFEINNLLTATKTALADLRTTKVIVDFLKKNLEVEQKAKLSVDQCRNIGNTLLFLRNILHIPDDVNNLNPSHSGTTRTVQNQILWNLFSQSIDKILIKLMTISDSGSWGVTMVQLIALLYKDQHVTTLHKLLNVWLESSLSESSEDNESNTTPPDRERADSSPMVTSSPTSDSSDTGGSGKCNDESNSANNMWDNNKTSSNENENGKEFTTQPAPDNMCIDYSNDTVANKNDNVQKNVSVDKNVTEETSGSNIANNKTKTKVVETSDYGYGTQIENQESISTSSNEETSRNKKVVHQKPHNPKQRPNTKARPNTATLQEKKRKKIVKRGKSNIINVQGLSHKTPTDDDISNVLKEFTVDFLLKGFNALVKTLHDQILSNQLLEIDTSHFFWLITYFLKFATQIELDLEQVSSVLSFDIVSYLTAEGVNICEQFELSLKLDGNDLKPCIRRLHLVVTAIRELVQAIEIYKKSAHLSDEDQDTLMDLQIKMAETEELRSLLLLLLRSYNPKYQSKQYLQDLIVTNHILLLFLDGLMKLPEFKGTGNMVDHIKQFANQDTMYQYGLLLENYEGNGEFVNDCVFTVMHHVSGELASLNSLYQPNILKTFISIWKTEFEICDVWSDLVEYVLNTFVKKPRSLQSDLVFELTAEHFMGPLPVVPNKHRDTGAINKSDTSKMNNRQKWSEDELSSLSWNYTQCNTLPDVIGGIVRMFKEEGIFKSRQSVLRELYKQVLITKDEFDVLSKFERETNANGFQTKRDIRDGEIRKLCEQIADDDKSVHLNWVQTVLLETCNVKIYLGKKIAEIKSDIISSTGEEVLEVKLVESMKSNLSLLSPVSYHSLLFNQSVPLVPWNCEQATICKDLRFLQLLHKLGFHMPVDTGKVFIRIPHFWTSDFLYEVAAKIAPIDTTKLKFSVSDISLRSLQNISHHSSFNIPVELTNDIIMDAPTDNFYGVHKQKHLASVVNYTPMPGSSFNSANNEMNKSSWLEIVHKSQDYELNLNLSGSTIIGDQDINMEGPDDFMRSNSISSVGVFSCGMSHSDTILSLPTMSIKQETNTYTSHLDSECNNSICETASVASDLTRMYVSDEDEKLEEEPDRPDRPIHEPLDVSLHPVIADVRPRMQFSSPFLSPDQLLPEF